MATRHLSQQATLDLPIPDHFKPGVCARLSIDAQPNELVTGLTVHVHAIHPRSGELRLKLTSPSGRTVLFYHSKTLSHQAEVIDTAWQIDGFQGEPAAGEWKLVAIDTLDGKEGKLMSWSLEARVESVYAPVLLPETRLVSFDQLNPAWIPDSTHEGHTSPIEVQDSGFVEEAGVLIDIDHPSIDQVEVVLTSPQGTTVTLKHIDNNAREDLWRLFEFEDDTDLDLIQGEPITGTWTLTVRDLLPKKRGKFCGWMMDLSVFDAAQPTGALVPHR